MEKGDFYYERAVRKLFQSMGYNRAEIDSMCPPLPPEPTNIASEELEDKPAIITKEQAEKHLERIKKMMLDLGTPAEKVQEYELEEIRKIDRHNKEADRRYQARKARRLERLRKYNRKHGEFVADLKERTLPGKSFEEMKKDIEARIRVINETVRKVREEIQR